MRSNVRSTESSVGFSGTWRSTTTPKVMRRDLQRIVFYTNTSHREISAQEAALGQIMSNK